MSNKRTPRLAVAMIIAFTSLSLTAAGMSVAGVSFMESVGNLFGSQASQSAVLKPPTAVSYVPGEATIAASDAIPIVYYDFEYNAQTFENVVEQSINFGNGPVSRAGNTTEIDPVDGAGFFNSGRYNTGKALMSPDWDTSTTDPGSAATNYYQVVVNTAGFSGISVTFDNSAFSNGPARVGLLYSTDGSTFTSSATTATGNVGFTASTFDLTGVTAVNDRSVLTLRIYAYAGDRTGRSSFDRNGGFRIDNLTVRSNTVTVPSYFYFLDFERIGQSISPNTNFVPKYSDFTINGPGVTVGIGHSDLVMGGTLTVANGTLYCGRAYVISGPGTFTLGPGGTLGILNESGITSSGASGNIQTATRNFDPGANYLYGSFGPQVTGSGLPAEVNNLSVDNSAGFTLSGPVKVNGVLIFRGSSSRIATKSNLLELGCTGTVSGAGGSNYVVGNFKKDFCGPGTFTFPSGTKAQARMYGGSETVGAYSPMTMTVNSGTFPAAVTVSVTASVLAGLDASNSVARTWNVSQTGGALNADMTFNYLDSDASGPEAEYHVFRNDGVATTEATPNSVNPAANTATVTGVTTFSNWGVGVLLPAAAAVSVSGRVLTADGRGIQNAMITVSGNDLPQPFTIVTGPFGYYTLNDLQAGKTYFVTVNSKRFRFANPTQIVTLNCLTNFDLIAQP